MSGDALFQIERALAETKDADKLALLSCKQIAHAVVAGATGKHWCTNFIDIAELAGDHGQDVLCCCALLAELIVSAADASDNEKAAPANNGTVDDPSHGASAHAAHGNCAAIAQPVVGNKRAFTMTTGTDTSCAGGGDSERDINDELALVGHLASLIRSRAKSAPTDHLVHLVKHRRQIVEQMQGGIAVAYQHLLHGKCPPGHLSVRSALGAAGSLAELTSTTKADKTINVGQRDDYRKYKKLDQGHAEIADGFRPLMDAIGYGHCVDPSVLENGVRHTTPFRQKLHLDGAPSVIVPLHDSGCRLDCLMKPDDESPHYLYRVTIFVPAGSCVVFNTFHGGSTGTWGTTERRVHAYLGAAPTGAVAHLLLEKMLKNENESESDDEHEHEQEDAVGGEGGCAGGGRQGERRSKRNSDVDKANKWLDLVPSRQQLQSAVPYPIELVCKVDRKSGREYDPFPGHNE